MFTFLVAAVGFAPAELPPPFLATRASDAEPVAGTVAKIAAGFAVTFAGPAPAVAADDLVSLARADKPRPPYPAGCDCGLFLGADDGQCQNRQAQAEAK